MACVRTRGAVRRRGMIAAALLVAAVGLESHATGLGDSVRPAPEINSVGRSVVWAVQESGTRTGRSNRRAGAPPVSDDRLSRDDQVLVEALIERGMPELVAALVSGRSPIHRIEVGRAWVRAGLDAQDDAERERCFAASAAEYRRVLAMEREEGWADDPARKVFLAAAKVELGDLMLRNWSAADLDRFELTSGLEFNAERLGKRLREALATYLSAAETLSDLQLALRTDEEEFLLLGLAGRIPVLARHCSLNQAWTAAYLVLTGAAQGRERAELLEPALRAFDAYASGTEDVEEKYGALLGAAVCLSLLGRYDEAHPIFDRARDSTASAATTARARFEKARSLIRQGQYGAARRETEELTARQGSSGGDGALFYVRVAPLVQVASYVAELKSGKLAPDAAAGLRQKAQTELSQIARRGGAWTSVVRVYLDVLAGGTRDLGQLTLAELRDNARRYMDEKRWADAASSLEQILGRSGAEAIAAQAEARFNLGVCNFQLGNLRSAGDAFLRTAASGTAGKLGPQAAEFALRCWQQVASQSKAPEDYRPLAEVCRILVERYPDHKLAAEAGWIGALASQEAGDFAAAQAAFAKVPVDSPNYWTARRNSARCAQRAYEIMPADADIERRATAGREAARTWNKLAEELTAAPDEKFRGAEEKRAWIVEAKAGAASALAGPEVKEYTEALRLLAALPDDARVLGLRIRCYRGMGDLKKANETLGEFLRKSTPQQAGTVLMGLAGEMEQQIDRLRAAGRRSEATALANEAVETVKELLRWLEGQPDRQQAASLVRFSLAKVLIQAQKRDEAGRLLDEMMAQDPENGTVIRQAALLHEEAAESAAGADRAAAERKAERLWARLLEDKGLRDAAPQQYYEARYHWLRHQLRQGKAAEVAKGIKAEQVWFPELGGPPWQGRLLGLLEEAQQSGADGGAPSRQEAPP